MLRLASPSRLLLVTSFAILGCSSEVVGDEAVAAAEQDWSSTPRCSPRDEAVRGLKAEGFVRTAESTSLAPIGGTQGGGYTYRETPLYRYEHADGRVAYAHCTGRMGVSFPVKGTTVNLAGTWSWRPSPGRQQSSKAPRPGTLKLVLRDFIVSGQGGAAIVADVDVVTPYTETKVGPSGYIQAPLSITVGSAPFAFDPPNAASVSGRREGSRIVFDYGVTMDPSGPKGPTSVKVVAADGFGAWFFDAP